MSDFSAGAASFVPGGGVNAGAAAFVPGGGGGGFVPDPGAESFGGAGYGLGDPSAAAAAAHGGYGMAEPPYAAQPGDAAMGGMAEAQEKMVMVQRGGCTMFVPEWEAQAMAERDAERAAGGGGAGGAGGDGGDGTVEHATRLIM